MSDFTLFEWDADALFAFVEGCADTHYAQLDQVSLTAAGTFRVPSSQGEEFHHALDLLVLDIRATRSYWSTDFGQAGDPPDCASPDGVTGYGTPGGVCRSCPLNAFAEGHRAKPCREYRELVALPPGDVFPLVLRIPRTSVGVVDQYRIALTRQGLHPTNVITHATLQPQPGKRFPRLALQAQEPLTADERERMTAYRARMLQQLYADESAASSDSA